MPEEDISFGQAAIPAVLTALYRFVQSDEGAQAFLTGKPNTNWVAGIFDDNRTEAIMTISSCTHEPIDTSFRKMNEIANEAVKVTKEHLPANAGIKELKVFFSNQRNNILHYLLPSLNMGDLLHDSTLDDNTNKMDGPLSGLMQSIGSAFSNPVTKEDIKPSH